MTNMNVNPPPARVVSPNSFKSKTQVNEGYDQLAFLAQEPNTQPAWAIDHQQKKKGGFFSKLLKTVVLAGVVLFGFKKVKITDKTPKLVKQLNTLANTVFGSIAGKFKKPGITNDKVFASTMKSIEPATISFAKTAKPKSKMPAHGTKILTKKSAQ